MNVLPIAGQLLRSRFSSPLFAVGHRLLRNDTLRRRLVRLADRWLSAQLTADKRTFSAGHRFAEERWLIARAVLHTVDRLIARQAIAPHVTGVITKLWGRALGLMVAPSPAWRRFQAENGCRPPLLITVSPGHACNLHCTGCYANSGPGTAKLPWSILDRVVTEAKALWGIPLVTFSGGEPLAYRSEGKDVLDIVQKHADLLYLMFTNGTLIDKGTAARLSRLGNLTPAISVEGLRSRTDAWRGAGTFDRVLQAMAHLREAGVPFGISVTVTRANCQEVLADEFLDFFFAQQGAFYGFLFHYMPIGRHASLEAMMTPEQRIAFWRRTWEVVAEKRIFLMDFWNFGTMVQGCISAGREGGYIYVDWNGKVMPCVFAPYAVADLQAVYAQGGTLNDVWRAPFFQAIRQWQREYGYGRAEPSRESNWLRPCPIRDHHGTFRELLARYQPEPEDEAAGEVLADGEYCANLVAYGQHLAEISQEIWEEEYLAGRSLAHR